MPHSTTVQCFSEKYKRKTPVSFKLKLSDQIKNNWNERLKTRKREKREKLLDRVVIPTFICIRHSEIDVLVLLLPL